MGKLWIVLGGVAIEITINAVFCRIMAAGKRMDEEMERYFEKRLTEQEEEKNEKNKNYL